MTEEICIAVILILALILLILFLYLNKDKNNIFSNNVYLDNNGTTMPCKEALKAYMEAAYLGNASGAYSKKAKEIISENDALIKEHLGCDGILGDLQTNSINKNMTYEVIYTSGASESNNTLIKSLVDNAHSNGLRPHLVLSAYEHKTSLSCALLLETQGKADVTLVAPGPNGIVYTKDVLNAMTPNTVLVSIMHVNNEIGTHNLIEEMAKDVKKKNPNVCFHSDIVQSFGKYPINIRNSQIDAVSASYHKIYGPQGIGILVVNKTTLEKIQNSPLIHGSQNYGARGGTINIAGIAASKVALETMLKDREYKNEKMFKMKKYLIDFLTQKYDIGDFKAYTGKPDDYTINRNTTGLSTRKSKCEIVFIGEATVSSTLLFSIVKYGPMDQHFCNLELRDALAKENIIISVGSACHAGSSEPSHVLTSIGAPYIIRCGVVRVSFGDYNSMSDVKRFCKVLAKYIDKQ